MAAKVSTSFEDLLEKYVEAEADHRYRFDQDTKNGRHDQRKCTGVWEERFLFAELEKSTLLRKKKRHRAAKPHRAVRTNDCRFEPKVKSGKGKFYMKARNYARIGRNRLKSELPSGQPVQRNVNFDAYYLTEGNTNQYGIEDTDLAQLLMALQNGSDVTPEDYERLLKLDERCASTSAASNTRRQMADHLLEASMDGLSLEEEESDTDTCTICMDSWVGDSSAKSLLCGHTFHSECLRHWWLTSPHMTCPLDNLDVRNMRPQMEGRVTLPSNVPLKCISI